MGEEVSIVITAVDNASKILTAVGKGFNAISGAVKDVTKQYIEYGAQVQTLALFSGTSNEQTSRLIQLTDDAFVSITSLEQAMKYMADKGLQPSVKNMAMLSDQFRAIKDPAEKSKFLIENFSRAGIEMSKVMDLGGKKILEMNASIADGLIIDDRKQASIQKTKQALDNFNDSIDAMKYDVADKLLGIFDAMPQPLKDATLALSGLLSQTNVNSMIQFGVLIKGMDLTALSAGISTAAVSMKAFAVSAWAAVAPVAAVAAAVLALVEIFRMDETKQVLALLWGKVGETVTGDKMRGALATQAAYTTLGGGQQSLLNDTGTGQTIRELLGMAQQQQPAQQLVYAPAISTASRQEIETTLRPIVNDLIRSNSGR